jgi:hypothetical protein
MVERSKVDCTQGAGVRQYARGGHWKENRGNSRESDPFASICDDLVRMER